MEITILGAVTIILSIYAFFKNKKLLLYMMVFLSTFTAANILNITATTTPVVTYEFTGAMWLLRELVDFIKTKPKINKDFFKQWIHNFKENKLALAFLIFIITILLGEVYLLISGLNVPYTDFTGADAVLKFGKSNIIRAIITVFIFVNMIVLSFKIKTREEVRELLKVFSISTMFAVVWGLLQFITFYLGVPYPAFLFNNNPYAAQCYDQLSNNVKRISSISLEPSTFAIQLICFIPFVLGTFLAMKDKIKSKKFILTFVTLALATACAILTTSSTAYVGLVTVYGLFGLYILFGFIKSGDMSDRKKNFLKMLAATVISIGIAAIICIAFVKLGYKIGTIQPLPEETVTQPIKEEEEHTSALGNMITMIKQMTIDKLGTGSGQERMLGEQIGLTLYKYSPIFGLGYCSVRTFSMFTNVLVNAGVLGVLALLYILFVVLKALAQYRKKDEVKSMMFFIAIVCATIGFFISVPDLELTYFWILIILGYKYATIKDEEQK